MEVFGKQGMGSTMRGAARKRGYEDAFNDGGTYPVKVEGGGSIRDPLGKAAMRPVSSKDHMRVPKKRKLYG